MKYIIVTCFLTIYNFLFNATMLGNIVGGILSAKISDLIGYIKDYFSDEEILKRKRLEICKDAIYDLINRYNISVWPGPCLPYQYYQMVMFELYCKYNNINTCVYNQNQYMTEVQNYYNNYSQCLEMINVYSIYEIHHLVIEVNSWGKKGTPKIYKYKHLSKIYKQWLRIKPHLSKCVVSKNSRMCDYLFEDYKLDNSSTKLLVLQYIQDENYNGIQKFCNKIIDLILFK